MAKKESKATQQLLVEYHLEDIDGFTTQMIFDFTETSLASRVEDRLIIEMDDIFHEIRDSVISYETTIEL